MQKAIRALQAVFVKTARANIDVIMPGYTHMQTGQPILFSHWMMAFFWMLERDFTRFSDLFKRMGRCPLGSAALAGTDFPIDRDFTAEHLGLRRPDGKLHRRRFRPRPHGRIQRGRRHVLHAPFAPFRRARDVLDAGLQDFIELSDDFCTGSSIMPQKKNPDIAEKIRGKTGRMYGNLMAILTIMKGIPLAYNTDLSEDKNRSSTASTRSCSRSP